MREGMNTITGPFEPPKEVAKVKVVEMPKADKESVDGVIDIAKDSNFQQIFIIGYTEEGSMFTLVNNKGKNSITKKDACWMLTTALNELVSTDNW